MEDSVSTITRLNTLLSDELAAVDTYAEALSHEGSLSYAADVLMRCQQSHAVRARMLHDKITSMGGYPVTSSGLREAWAERLEARAVAVGDDVALRALVMGEQHVLSDYRARIPKLESGVRAFVERNVLPGEEYTFRMVDELLHHMR